MPTAKCAVTELSKNAYLPWLVVGKGPTFSTLADSWWWRKPSMFLNHSATMAEKVGLRYSRDMAYMHAVDLEPVLDCAQGVLSCCYGLVMPWMPNQGLKRGRDTLDDLINQYGLFALLAEQGRLFAYNRSGAASVNPTLATVGVRYFSAEGAFGALALAGVRHVRVAGIDGGKSYAPEFKMTPLSNGRATFDDQLKELEAVFAKNDMRVELFETLTAPDDDYVESSSASYED